MWLGTYRLMQIVAESHRYKELRQELRLHRRCEEVVLDPFSEVEVAEYLQQRLPDRGIQEAFIHKLHDHTGGLAVVSRECHRRRGCRSANPQRGRFLRASRVRSRSTSRDSLPKHSDCSKPPASAASSSARPPWPRCSDRTCNPITRQCDDLAQGQYWLQHVAVVDLPDGTLDARYAFRHALYRHVFYQRQGASTRVQMHRRVAAALERGRAAGVAVTAAELASQHESGLAHAAALRYYIEAARSAVNNFAPREAIDITSHALALLPRCPEGNERLELEFALVSIRGLACSRSLDWL